MLFHLSNRPMKEVSFYGGRNWQFSFVILEFHLSRKSNISNELVNHIFFVMLIIHNTTTNIDYCTTTSVTHLQ
jgi:hypothetical protein